MGQKSFNLARQDAEDERPCEASNSVGEGRSRGMSKKRERDRFGEKGNVDPSSRQKKAGGMEMTDKDGDSASGAIADDSGVSKWQGESRGSGETKGLIRCASSMAFNNGGMVSSFVSARARVAANTAVCWARVKTGRQSDSLFVGVCIGIGRDG